MMNKETKLLMKMALMLSLLIISAKMVIPLPFLDYLSLQIVVVYLCYPMLGLYRATAVLALYVVIGILGLPVFASGGGPMYALKPSFGFLIAYIGLPLVQSLFDHGSHASFLQRCFIGNYIGLIFIHLIGFTYKVLILRVVMKVTAPILNEALIASSLLDFATDCVLVLIATMLTTKLRHNFFNNQERKIKL